jgi:predicted TIM-barrel fold metal-dependent hydrolase
MWFDSVYSFDPLSLRTAVDAVGVERIMLGSDYPAFSDDITISVNALHDCGLPHEHIHQILDENAARLLGLQ